MDIKSIMEKIETAALALVKEAEGKFKEPKSGGVKYQYVVDKLQALIPMGEIIPDSIISGLIEAAVEKLEDALGDTEE